MHKTRLIGSLFIGDKLDAALSAFQDGQPIRPSRAAVLKAALEEYLVHHGGYVLSDLQDGAANAHKSDSGNAAASGCAGKSIGSE